MEQDEVQDQQERKDCEGSNRPIMQFLPTSGRYFQASTPSRTGIDGRLKLGKVLGRTASVRG